MLSHTLPLEGRENPPLHLTADEAVDLHQLGFRFAIFRPGVEECRLSMPFETLVDFDAKTLTIRQAESAR